MKVHKDITIKIELSCNKNSEADNNLALKNLNKTVQELINDINVTTHKRIKKARRGSFSRHKRNINVEHIRVTVFPNT